MSTAQTILPALTPEEWECFRKVNKEFFQHYGLVGKMSLGRRVGMALLRITAAKCTGALWLPSNEAEAAPHFIKACMYDPTIAKNSPSTRRSLKKYMP